MFLNNKICYHLSTVPHTTQEGLGTRLLSCDTEEDPYLEIESCPGNFGPIQAGSELRSSTEHTSSNLAFTNNNDGVISCFYHACYHVAFSST